MLCCSQSRSTMGDYGSSLATRGLLHSNSRQVSVGFRPLHKPNWLLVNKNVSGLRLNSVLNAMPGTTALCSSVFRKCKRPLNCQQTNNQQKLSNSLYLHYNLSIGYLSDQLARYWGLPKMGQSGVFLLSYHVITHVLQ